MKRPGPTTRMDEDDWFAREFDYLARTASARRYDRLLELVPPQAHRALDAGCGPGLLTVRLAGGAQHVVGLDIAPSMLSRARQHRAEQKQPNVSFVVADLEALPFSDGSFDVVLAAASVQRTRLRVTLGGLRRLVRPGGRLILYVTVSSFPRLRDWRPARALMSIPVALGYLRAHGVRTAWRLTRFQTSRAWIEQGQRGEKGTGRRVGGEAPRSATPVPTPAALDEMCQELLPGCRVERTYSWAMTIVWDASLS